MADDKKKKNYPSPPSEVKVAGNDETVEMTTKRLHEVPISAVVYPFDGHQVKLKAQYSSNDFKPGSVKTEASDWGMKRREHLTLSNLKVNTLYKVRLWTIAQKSGDDQVSKDPNTVSFWTARYPTVELVTPVENSEYNENQTILFDWKFIDADEPEQPTQ